MKRLVWLVIFFLCMGIVNAEFSEEKAKTWLNDRIVWSQASIEEISFATMALKSNTGLNKLKSKEDTQKGCFPKDNCNTKDTALSALALKDMNNPITKQLKYLEDNLKAASFNKGEWNIQIVINEEGTCKIDYEENRNGINFNFNEQGNVEGTDSSWINFNSLTNFNFDKGLEEINVDCDFTSTPRISIIKEVGNSIYIIEEKFSKEANFKLENGCYALNLNSQTCDKSSSFYVSWVLKKLGEEITTENYLKDNVDSDLEYSIISKIDNNLLSQLIEKQNEQGDFDNSVYVTSFAINSLKNSNYNNEMSEAKTWVESQQNENGMIGTGVKDTAVALYLIYGIIVDLEDEGGEECIDNSYCEEGEICNIVTGFCEPQTTPTESCNNNFNCEIALGENSFSCSTDCFCGDEICDNYENEISCSSDCKEEITFTCGNFNCETSLGENSFNCPGDCPGSEDGGGDSGGTQSRCGDGFCDFGEEDSDSCPEDCEPKEGGKSLWWLWLIIIILVLGGILFFVLSKMKKGKTGGETPSYLQRPRIPPNYPQQQYKTPARGTPRNEALESELDRSIKEAQELLKRKK